MDNEVFNNITDEEKKVLDLAKDEDFRKKFFEVKNMEKSERADKIKKILLEKGIEYTKEDAELFDEIVDCASGVKLDQSNLEKITAGSSSDLSAEEMMNLYSMLPDDIKKKIQEKNKSKIRKAKLIAGTVITTLCALLFGAGGAVGYYYGKKNSQGNNENK